MAEVRGSAIAALKFCIVSISSPSCTTRPASCSMPRRHHGSLACSHIGHSHVDSSRSLRDTPRDGTLSAHSTSNHTTTEVSTLMTHPCTCYIKPGLAHRAWHSTEHSTQPSLTLVTTLARPCRMRSCHKRRGEHLHAACDHAMRSNTIECHRLARRCL